MMVKVVDEYGPMGYRKHKNKTESKEYLNRILHSNTYNEWISRLRKCNILTQPSESTISRRDGKPGGRSIPIELTYIAKKKLKLGILSIPDCEEEDEQKRLAQLYQLILYFLAAKPKPGLYDYGEFSGDKHRINEVLTCLHPNCCSVDTFEEEETIQNYWNKNLVTVVYKSPSPCLIIWKEIMTAADDPSKSSILYHGKTLGLCVYDMCIRQDRPFFKNIEFSAQEIQEVFDRLVDTGVVKVIGHILGVARYDLADERLGDVIREIWSHHEFVLSETYPLYDTKFHPKHEWRKWMKQRQEWLDYFNGGGELDARITIRNNPHERIDKEDADQWAEFILDRSDELKARYSNEFANFEFILDRLVQIAYPPFLERAVRMMKAKHTASFKKKHSKFFYYLHERDKHSRGSERFIHYSDKMMKYCLNEIAAC
jgi:hypothetical protein